MSRTREQIRRFMLSLKVPEQGCGHCGYAVQEWTSSTCPECGTDREKIDPVQPFGYRRFVLSVYLVVWSVVAFIVGLCALWVWGSVQRIYYDDVLFIYRMVNRDFTRLERWEVSENTEWVVLDFKFETVDYRYCLPFAPDPGLDSPVIPNRIRVRLWLSLSGESSFEGQVLRIDPMTQAYILKTFDEQVIETGTMVDVELMNRMITRFGGKHNDEEKLADAEEMLRLLNQIIKGNGQSLDAPPFGALGRPVIHGRGTTGYIKHKYLHFRDFEITYLTWFDFWPFVVWLIMWLIGLRVVRRKAKGSLAPLENHDRAP